MKKLLVYLHLLLSAVLYFLPAWYIWKVVQDGVIAVMWLMAGWILVLVYFLIGAYIILDDHLHEKI